MKIFGRKRSHERLQAALRGGEPPTFPAGVVRLLRLLRDPESDTADLAAALAWDPRLVVRLLRTANSAAFGCTRRIESVHHAVTMIGRSQLEQLVLGVAVRDCLPKAPARGFESDRFWQAAFLRAALAGELAAELHPADHSRSFTGALLQDMAVPLLAHARPDDYGPVLEQWHAAPQNELFELERDALGFSHAEVGAQLGAEWELPESLTAIIERHHDREADDRELPPALRLVALHREGEGGGELEALLEEARSGYGLQPDWLRDVIAQCRLRAQELARALT
jgi:HD-like signal output (HDOD) protein